MKGTMSISWGNYGGFYFRKNYSTRICLGWIAFTYLPVEIDDIISDRFYYEDLAAAHKEYSEFLGKEVSDLSIFAATRGVEIPQHTIDKGDKLRNKIKQLENDN